VWTALKRRRGDEGFSLVEVLVALTLFALVAAAVVPLLVLSGSAAVAARKHTRAKNLAQERVELMRQLPYQVDFQNGPFIDLLDRYYPNRTPATGQGTGWVSATATNRLQGEPTTGSYYRTRFDVLDGQPGFRQVVAVQFLRLDRTPVPDARFANYQHNSSGRDAAPSTLLGVTVLTYWRHTGGEQVFRTFTQIGNPGGQQSLLSNRASASLLRIESALSEAVSVTTEALNLTADGALSDGSSAAVRAVAGRTTRTGEADLLAAVAESVDPPPCTGDTCPDPQPGNVGAGPVGSCTGLSAFGRSRAEGITSTTAEGRPRVPSTVTTTPSARATTTLLRESGQSCGALAFSHLDGRARPDLLLRTDLPVVSIAGDATDSGSTPVAASEVFLDATSEEAASRYVRAGARTTTSPGTSGTVRRIRLFPTTFAPDGVMQILLQQARITCDTSAAAASGTYTVQVLHWSAPANGYVNLAGSGPVTWTSGTAFTDPFATVNMASKVVHSSGLKLSDYVPQPPRLATALAIGETNGVASIGDAVLSLTTAPARVEDLTASLLVADPLSTIGLKVGLVSCVAVDER
jgi:prepilin-type N-terminal cleavage/methylation domain-containing protein